MKKLTSREDNDGRKANILISFSLHLAEKRVILHLFQTSPFYGPLCCIVYCFVSHSQIVSQLSGTVCLKTTPFIGMSCMQVGRVSSFFPSTNYDVGYSDLSGYLI